MSLHVRCCLSFVVVSCSLLVVCCLFGVCCSLFAVRCLLFAVRCALFGGCVWFVVCIVACCLLFVV